MVLLSQIYTDEKVLSNFLILSFISKVPMCIFSLPLFTDFQAGMLIPVTPEPRSRLVFQLQANNLSGVWKYISGVCDFARNQVFQGCLLEETLLCASHFLILALNVNSKQLQETQVPLEVAVSVFHILQSHMHIDTMEFL